MNEVEREIILPVSPARVWEALSDPEQLSAWFGAQASMEVRPRGRATFRWPDGTERAAVVETAEEPRLLVFRWLPFERVGQESTRRIAAGRVRIALEPRRGGTLLTVVESGTPAGADVRWDAGVPSGSLGQVTLPVAQLPGVGEEAR
jgi:uncharacterized protein YndB with AHSA1/START domain